MVMMMIGGRGRERAAVVVVVWKTRGCRSDNSVQKEQKTSSCLGSTSPVTPSSSAQADWTTATGLAEGTTDKEGSLCRMKTSASENPIRRPAAGCREAQQRRLLDESADRNVRQMTEHRLVPEHESVRPEGGTRRRPGFTRRLDIGHAQPEPVCLSPEGARNERGLCPSRLKVRRFCWQAAPRRQALKQDG